MYDRPKMPLASREFPKGMITQTLAALNSSGISIYRDRFFSGGEVTDYYFRAFIQTEPLEFDDDDGFEEYDLAYDALLVISSNYNEIQVVDVVRMNIASFGRYIGTNDEVKAVAIKIPDEYLVRLPYCEEDAISLAEKYLELLFIWLERKPPIEGNISVSVSRSHFYDVDKVIDKDLKLKDVLRAWWM